VIFAMHAGTTVLGTKNTFAPVFADAHFIEYGMGWFSQDYHGSVIVLHGGQTDGMHANLALVPELRLGIVVLTNSVVFGYPSAITYRIIDAFKGRPARDWSSEVRTRLGFMNDDGPRRPPPRVAGAGPSIPVAELAGRYRQDYLGEAEVTIEGGVASIAMLGQRARLEHWHFDTYRPGWTQSMSRGVLPFVTFERGGDGRVAGLRFDRNRYFARVR
jgi:hypothetical protein